MNKVSLLLFVSLLFVLIGFISCDDGDGGGGGAGAGQGAPAPVPQTGQTTCWDEIGNVIDCAGTGQDGDIQAGVVPPVPRFTDNGEGQITDNLTGLVWLKDMDCLRGTRTWQQALDFANTLADGQCGLTDGSRAGDWRLPNWNELRSLLDLENFFPALPTGHPFMNIQPIGYWSSTKVAFNPFSAFDVSLTSGIQGAGDKDIRFFVTAVRDPRFTREAAAPVPQTGQTTCWDEIGNVIDCAGTGQDGDIQAGVVPPVPRFTDNGDGTVTDNLTGLVWLKDASCFEQHRWAQALTDANGLADGKCGLSDGSMAGDWYLPNLNQLTSLLDLENFDPALPTGHPFMNIQPIGYWSSTTVAFNPFRAWGVSLTLGGGGIGDKTDFHFALPVRGGS